MSIYSFSNTIIFDACSDAFIHSQHIDNNYGSETYIRVGSALDPAYDMGIKRGFVKFDLTSIPAECIIEHVVLKAFQTDGYIGNGFQVIPVLSSWEEDTITWNNQPIVDNSLGIIEMVSGGICTFESDSLTELVQSWIVNGNNFGISFRFHDENYQNTETSLLGDTFTARENTNQDRIPPQLEIQYHLAAPSLQIFAENDTVYLTWDSLSWASTYTIFTAENAFTSIENWTIENDSITDNSWSSPIANRKKFYYVRAKQ